MDKLKIFEALGLHPYGTFTIINLHMVAWGRDLTFACVYDPGPPGKPRQFELILKDCRELRWRIYTHVEVDGTQPIAHVVNFTLGTSQHRKPLNILTDHFALTAHYGALLLQDGDTLTALSGGD